MEQIIYLINNIKYYGMYVIPVHVSILLLCTCITGSLVWLFYCGLQKTIGKDNVKLQYYAFRLVILSFMVPVVYGVTMAMHTDFRGGWTGEYLSGSTRKMDFVFWSFLLIWSIGFCKKCVQLVHEMRILRRLKCSQRECRKEEREILEKVCQEKKIHKRIGLYKNGMIQNPCISGIWNPCIYMGNGQYTKEEANIIYQHELTHYQHRDILFRMLVQIASMVYWFHPLFFSGYMKKKNSQLGEDFCDCCMCEKNDQGKYIYTLLKIALQVQESPVLSGVAAAENMSEVRRRIEKMEKNARQKPGKKSVVVLSTVCFLLAGTVSVSAAGMGIVQGYEAVFALTDDMIKIEHQPDYVPEYTIYTDEAVFDEDLLIEEDAESEIMRTAGVQAVEKTVNSKTVSKLATLSAAGTKVTVNLTIEPTNKIVEVGLINKTKGTKDYIKAKHIAATSFTVKKGNTYELYVSNTNNVAIEVYGSYSNK